MRSYLGGRISDGNSTSTPLGIEETFTGVEDRSPHSDAMITCKTDADGTLYVDMGVVPGVYDTSLPFPITADTGEFHTIVKGTRYFRVRLVNGSGAQTYLRLMTEFGTFRQSNSPLNATLQSDSDAQTVKAVLSGVGNTTAAVTDHRALQVTSPPEGKTAFGEQVVAEAQPVVQITFPYVINPGLVSVRENASGTITHGARQAVLSTGAASSSSAEMRSKRILKYNPGQGGMARFTAVFTAGAANSTQMIGIGNESDGLFFGYNGTSFGILHRRNGRPEIRTLTVTTKSSDAENITITLDGDAASVAVTNGADTTVTANEIAAHDYSSVGRGWTAWAVGSTVQFESWDGTTHSGTFSLSGATSAVGTFAQNVVGTAPTDTWIPQASWNGEDNFDGTGLTGVTLDPTKGNVYQIRYQWLGYGAISFYIEDPDDGELHLVHAIEYANANTSPSMGDPSLELSALVENTSNSTDIVLKTSSLAAFVEGSVEQIGKRLGVRGSSTSVASTLIPIISVRQGKHWNGYAVKTFSRILRIAASCDHVKPITLVLLRDPTLVGASWADVESGESSIQVDTSATSLTGGKEQYSLPMGQTSNAQTDYASDYYANTLAPGEVFTIAAVANSGTGGEVNVSLKMLERL